MIILTKFDGSERLPVYCEYIDLGECRGAYEAGNLAGLYDVLCFYKLKRLSLPEWAADAVTTHFGDYICGASSKKWVNVYKRRMIDLERASMVKSCSDHSISWDNVYQAASMLLTGTFAAGGEHAMETSYKSFIKVSKQNPFSYYESKFIRIENDLRPGVPMTTDRLTVIKKIEKTLKRKSRGK